MKQSIWVLSVLLLATILIPADVQAQRSGMGRQQAGTDERGEKSSMMKGMMMHGMMMRSAMPQDMKVTEDGEAVFVLAGNRIMKYDGDLNLVREVEVSVDFSRMEEMMQEMRERQLQMRMNAGADRPPETRP